MLTLVYPDHHRQHSIDCIRFAKDMVRVSTPNDHKALIGIRLGVKNKLYHYSYETVKATQLALYLYITGTTQHLFSINHK